MSGSEARVVVQDVWKKFRSGERQDSLRDLIPAAAARLMGRVTAGGELQAADFWAVQDVSFEVREGEALGIIGPNGAGKSTMLKLLNRILRPTRGRIALRGRTAALIEVSAGFHQDLTGRENIFLQGAIMGMRRQEMLRKMDSIIDFAGVERFIDTPVKRYSSGMNARLGFSIAAHVEPDILLIDEVLSVGDMAFQEKCVARMKEFKRSGVAIVFISHNMQAVSSLCDTAIHLHSSVRAHGSVSDAIASYLLAGQTATVGSASTEVSIVGAHLETAEDGRMATVDPGTPLRLLVDYEVNDDVEDLHFGLVVYRSTDGFIVYDGTFRDQELGIGRLHAGQSFRVTFDLAAHMTRGQYHIECHVHHNPTTRFLARFNPAAHVRVDETRTAGGVADLDARATLVMGGVDQRALTGAAS